MSEYVPSEVDRRINPDKKTVEIILRNVPREVRDFFKAHCYQRGSNVTQTIVAFMRSTVLSAQRQAEQEQNIEQKARKRRAQRKRARIERGKQ